MCTSIRFTDNSGHMYLGRNLDWSFDYGQQVRVMPRGFHIPYSFIDDVTAAHAVIGMCIDYKNYPMFFDCGNDAGLAVAGLNFPGYAEYAEDPVDGKTNIAAYEFPLWVAATFSTVDEVEAALRDTVIVAKSAGEGLGVSLLHWIIGDSQRSIVVEMMADGLHVYDDPVDTLANQPTFPWHMENLRRCRHARHSGRLLFAEPFCKGGVPQCQLPAKGERDRKRRSHVPLARGRGDDRGGVQDGR